MEGGRKKRGINSDLFMSHECEDWSPDVSNAEHLVGFVSFKENCH